MHSSPTDCLCDVLSFSAEEVSSAADVTSTRLAWMEKQNAALRVRLREEQELVNQQLKVSTSLAAALESADARHPVLRSAAVRASLVSVGQWRRVGVLANASTGDHEPCHT
jgi:hypothetical protein